MPETTLLFSEILDLVHKAKTKDKKDVYTKFRGDIVVDILEYLEGDIDEEE